MKKPTDTTTAASKARAHTGDTYLASYSVARRAVAGIARSGVGPLAGAAFVRARPWRAIEPSNRIGARANPCRA